MCAIASRGAPVQRSAHVRRTGIRLLPAAAAAAVLVLSGCGGSSGEDNPTLTEGSGSPSASSSLKDLLPQAVRDKGKLVVGSDVAYPPVEFTDTDGKTAIGLDPDIAAAIGEKLGIK